MKENIRHRDFVKKLDILPYETVKEFVKHLLTNRFNERIIKLTKALRPLDKSFPEFTNVAISKKIYGRSSRFSKKTLNSLFSNANKKLEYFLAQKRQATHPLKKHLAYIKQLGLEQVKTRQTQQQETDIYASEIKSFQKTYFAPDKEDQHFPIKNIDYYQLKKEINSLERGVLIRQDTLKKRRALFFKMQDCRNIINAIEDLRDFCVLENMRRNIEEVDSEKLNQFKAKVAPLLKIEPVKHESLQLKLWWYQAKLMLPNANVIEILDMLQDIFDAYVIKTAYGLKSKSSYSDSHKKADLRELAQVGASLVAYYHGQGLKAHTLKAAQEWFQKAYKLLKQMIEEEMIASNTPLHYKNFINISINLADFYCFTNKKKEAEQLIDKTRSFYEKNKEKLLNNNGKNNFMQYYSCATILFYEKKYKKCNELVNGLRSKYGNQKEETNNNNEEIDSLSKQEINNNLSLKILDFKLAYTYEGKDNSKQKEDKLDVDKKLKNLQDFISNKQKAILVSISEKRLEKYKNFRKQASILINYKNQSFQYRELDKTKVEATIKQVQEQAPIQKYWLLNELQKLVGKS